MKKILKFAFLGIVLIFAFRQTYWIVSRGGNLNVYAYNSSDVEIVTMEVFVNGESIDIQDYSNKNTLDYEGLALYKSTGIHKVKVVAASHDISKTVKFDLVSAKWISFEFANDETDPSKYVLHLSVESSPKSKLVKAVNKVPGN
jgi:hypothetical protein